MKLIVTIPAYNEEKTIDSVVKEIPRQVEGVEEVEVLVIDDGCTDETVPKAIEAGADHVFCHKRNEGLGVTFRDGLEYALELGADIIVNIDSDGQYNANEIPALIKPIRENKADIVLGWRDIDKLGFMPKGKRVGNKIATWFTTKVTGMPIKDAQSGFRAFSREAALRMNLSGRYTYVQQTIMEAMYKGLKIEQVPIEFRPRHGESRLIPNLATYARRAGGTILGTYWGYHPLKVFSMLGGVLMMGGVACGLALLVYFILQGTISSMLPLAVGGSLLFVTGLQAILLGLFADLLKGQRRFQEEILYRLKRQYAFNGNNHNGNGHNHNNHNYYNKYSHRQ